MLTRKDIERSMRLEWATDVVTVETMPDCFRASHRAAGNWGRYPQNGACRERMPRVDAEQIVADDEDGYAHIVEGA